MFLLTDFDFMDFLVGGTKDPSNGHGHVTKMAVMSIYVKNI